MFIQICFYSTCIGPAPEGVTDTIYKLTTSISEYKICKDLNADLSKLGEQQFNVDGHQFTIQVIDSVADYVDYMKEIFDFPAIKSYLSSPDVNVLLNSMNGGQFLKYLYSHFFLHFQYFGRSKKKILCSKY